MSSLIGMAAAMGMGAGGAAVTMPLRGYEPGRHKVHKPKQNRPSTKLQRMVGRIGLTHPTKGSVADGVSISPKKDIGKGPAWTMPVRGYSTSRQERIMAKHMRRELKAKGL